MHWKAVHGERLPFPCKDYGSGAINASALKEISNENLKAYVKLAEVIGKLLSQVRKDSLIKISICYSGELFRSSTKLLATALLKRISIRRNRYNS